MIAVTKPLELWYHYIRDNMKCSNAYSIILTQPWNEHALLIWTLDKVPWVSEYSGSTVNLSTRTLLNQRSNLFGYINQLYSVHYIVNLREGSPPFIQNRLTSSGQSESTTELLAQRDPYTLTQHIVTYLIPHKTLYEAQTLTPSQRPTRARTKIRPQIVFQIPTS